MAPVLTVESLVGKTSINSIEVHPDGNLLGLGCSDGSVKLWNITVNEIVTSLEDNIKVRHVIIILYTYILAI